MEREVKFRGISEDTGKWIYGSYHKPFKDVEQIIEKTKGNASQMSLIVFGTGGEFAGLHDKNGVEIYFGDVCERDEWIAGKKVKTRCIIEYSIDRFIPKWITDTMYNDSLRYHYEHLEVIGNIYQHPELLK